MTQKEIADTIIALRDDANYYGELGRRFLSNSDIVTIHNEPYNYGKGASGLPLLQGDYMHKRILQPELIKDIPVVQAKTRRNKEYTEFVAQHQIEGQDKPIFLLQSEVDDLEMLAHKIEGNAEFVDALQTDIQQYEVEEPALGQIHGYWFKGKADRINRRRGFIADLKTTRSLSSFRQSLTTYGYHSQAYIYEKLFGLPVRFYVISKEDGRLAVVDIRPETLEVAENYVTWGLDKLEMYYGDQPREDIDQYYDYWEL